MNAAPIDLLKEVKTSFTGYRTQPFSVMAVSALSPVKALE